MTAIAEEDVELRELLVSNLESRGILSKIKAELRAAIFQCLDDKPTKDSPRSDENRVNLSICADTLRRLGLLNTLKVLEAEVAGVLESPLMDCDEVENLLGVEHTAHPILNSLLSQKPSSVTPPTGDALNKLKEKAHAEFKGYDHCHDDRIHIDDAPNALMDVAPFVPEHIAHALFAEPGFEQQISFDTWWNEIEKFHTVAKHLTIGTQPEKDLADITADLKLDLNKNDAKHASGDFAASTQLTNRSTTAPISYTRDDFTEDFESRTEKTESEIEDEITGGQLPDSGSESSFQLQSAGDIQPAKQHDNLTEDFSLRSDEMSKYADFMENV